MITSAASNAASGLVAALERAWTEIHQHHPDVPQVVMVVVSGSVGRRGELTLGHFADRRWTVASTERPEPFVGGRVLLADRSRCWECCCTKPPMAWPPPAASRTPAAKATTTTAATSGSPRVRDY